MGVTVRCPQLTTLLKNKTNQTTTPNIKDNISNVENIFFILIFYKMFGKGQGCVTLKDANSPNWQHVSKMIGLKSTPER